MSLSDLMIDAGQIAAFAVVGSALMLAGYLLTDALTPGKLSELIWRERNANAATLVSANLLSVGIIVFTAIRSSNDGFVDGLVSTAVFGVVGLVFMAVSFLVLDALTPGKLGALVTHPQRHPAVWVSASAHLATALMMSAAIS